MRDQIRLVPVWTGWLRLSHWLMACGVMFAAFSAWLAKDPRVDAHMWQDWHVMISQLLVWVIGLRLALLFTPGSAHWSALLPGRMQLRGMVQMLKFYISFARFPLPAWYAHNPLWQPLYVVMLLLLVICVASGFVQDSRYAIMGHPMYRIHSASASYLGALCVIHAFTVMLHDWKGKGAHISAMISGNRYFHSEERQAGGSATVSLSSLSNSKSGTRNDE